MSIDSLLLMSEIRREKFYGPTDGPQPERSAKLRRRRCQRRRLLSEVDDVFVAGLPLQGGVQRSHLLGLSNTVRRLVKPGRGGGGHDGVTLGKVGMQSHGESCGGPCTIEQTEKTNAQQNGYPTISSKIMEEPRLDDGKDQEF